MEREGLGVHLRQLEIENFKSYKGSVIIGPLRPFTAVIGPNGSGKSNFMDAISFVFGEQARSMRVRKLNELIHGSNVNDPAATKCSVTAVLAIPDEEDKRFQRIVKVSGNDAISDYRIDGKSVGNKQYMEALESYNIVIKPRNFLVFQGQVEMIATMNPKQRTVLLEKISGSGDLKDDYERLEKELEQSNEEMRKAFTKKKEVAVEEKDAKEDKKLADEYEKCQKDLVREKAQLQLFELYHKDREMDDIKKEVRRQKQATETMEADKHIFEDGLKDAKKKLGEANRELSALDQQIRSADAKVTQARPEHLGLKTKIEHLQTKIESEERMLNALCDSQKKLDETINTLTDEKDTLETAKADFEASQTQTQEVQSLTQLSPAQSSEYHRLKKEASRRLTAMTQELEGLRRELKKDKDALASHKLAQEDDTKELQQHRKEKDQMTSRVNRLDELKRKSKEEKEKLTATCSELEGSLDGLAERMADVTAKLQEIARKYADVRVDEREMSRKAKKEELITKLKQLYGDEVFGRLIDCCHHSHERYQLAVTKILGKYMNGIIVSSSQIASQCISYMKQQELEPEQFIPLNSLELKPLAEHLRRLEPDTVKLVVDVISITHADKSAIQKAVRFACGNAVTCQDVDTARRLAYGRDKLHVVTWSGTLFDKGGTISGGAQELKAKARRWDEKEMAKMKSEQQKLQEELRELQKARRKESDLKTLTTQCEALEARIKYAEKDRKEAEASLKDLDKQIEALEGKESGLIAKLKAAEEKVAKSEKKLRDLEKKMNTLEDDVFAEFCVEIGVTNIRQYEAQEMSERQERDRRLMEFVKQINKLGEQLSYQKSKQSVSTEKVERSQKSLTKLKKDLKACQESEKQKEKELKDAEARLAKIKSERQELQTTVEERETTVDEQKKELAAISKKLGVLTRQLQVEESKREQLKLERRTVLQYCKMNNVELPFEKGSMDDIGLAMVASDLTQSTQADSSQETTLNSSQLSMEEKETNIKLDYSKLPERLKRQLELGDRTKEAEKMQNRVKDIEGNLDKLNLPKANASERLGEIKTKVRQTATDLDKARERVIDLSNQFDRIKRDRYKKFTDCLDTISRSIDPIYKELVSEDSAEAFLSADNQEFPYNGGITFSLVVPGKNYRTIDALSGGEKTLASLSLLFAIHAAHPSPFFIMDEVDAALDNTNILRVAQFMRKKSGEEFQIIIISLKEEMYHHVDALVGIYPEPADVCISRNLTLDLNQYDRTRNESRTKK